MNYLLKTKHLNKNDFERHRHTHRIAKIIVKMEQCESKFTNEYKSLQGQKSRLIRQLKIYDELRSKNES